MGEVGLQVTRLTSEEMMEKGLGKISWASKAAQMLVRKRSMCWECQHSQIPIQGH